MSRYRGVERHNYATRRLYDPAKNPGIRPFRGVDGEGGNVPEQGTMFDEITRHQYLSLRIGPELLETGKPLTWEECFDFICSQPKQYIYVSYFFDYDVTMMIRTMPQERATRLLQRHKRIKIVNGFPTQPMPLDIGVYECDYLPHKEFKVRRKGDKHWYVISDVGPFFQQSFLNTLEKWNIGSVEDREMIRKGKSMRADFGEFTEEIRAYNALECLLLEQLMTEFREVCYATGYVPKKWQGPGYLASAMLDRWGIPRRDDVPILKNPDFRALAQAAYYGGRFETTAAGPIPGPVYQYDINGAYVSLLRTLPCLQHGSWAQIHERPELSPDTPIWFGEVHFNHHEPAYLYNLPVRRANGTIYYPKEGNGVYWSTELQAAERNGTSLDFKSGWVYEAHCDCRWFDWVEPYYQERLALGKTAKGYVLKLAGNSVYGKLAQSIGYAPWANPVWAGLITAGCRAMLIDAYSQCPDKCYMLATDGLFVGEPLSLPVSKALGEWESTVHPEGMFIVQPGIYFLGSHGEVKTRGIERGRINAMRDEFDRQWSKFVDSYGVNHTVSVRVDNFLTAKQAIHRRKWQIAGTWERTWRDISYDWSIKRVPGVGFQADGMFRHMPWSGGPDIHSVPYSRLIGGGLVIDDADKYTDLALEESARMEEQPDWCEPLFSSPEA